MLARTQSRGRGYWGWMALLASIIALGGVSYLRQLGTGLGITGLSRDVSWGFYIAQFTFLVGVAASAVMVVLPYYLHDAKAFGKMTILGELLAIAAVTMCMLFVFVDMGQPARLMNVMLHPSPHSLMFWDIVSLSGYLVLNALIAYVTLTAERKGVAAPSWIKPVILLSIPWAVSIHTVTAFLYSGLSARPFWMSAILAPRFLASAFASGPALLILIAMLLRKVTRFDAGFEAIGKLSLIVTYAMTINVFFVLMEVFTTFYSGIPEHREHFEFLYTGLGGVTTLAPWMWASGALALLALALLYRPAARRNERTLALACGAVFFSIWIDKGLGMVVTGFIPSPLGTVASYVPTSPELLISLAIYAFGLLLVSSFYRIALSIRGELP